MRPSLAFLALGSLLVTSAALSQEAPAQPSPAPIPAPAAAPPEPEALKGIEEIIVTAERREQNIQDLPQAVTAFSPSQLEEANIQDAYDLQLKVPGLVATCGRAA